MKTQTPKTTTRHYKHLPQNKAHVSQELKPIIVRSDQRIKGAIAALQGSERGKIALSNMRKMCERAISDGFEMDDFAALIILVREVAFGRREFLHRIKKEFTYSHKVLLVVQDWMKEVPMPHYSEYVAANVRGAIEKESVV